MCGFADLESHAAVETFVGGPVEGSWSAEVERWGSHERQRCPEKTCAVVIVFGFCECAQLFESVPVASDVVDDVWGRSISDAEPRFAVVVGVEESAGS